MKKMIAYFSLFIFLIFSCSEENPTTPNDQQTFANTIDSNRMLLVLSAPSVDDTYYAPAFSQIVDFQVNYINSILGNDNAVLLVNSATKRYYEGRIPEDVMLVSDVYDIWMRDFTTINPESPVQFTYTWASMTRQQSREVQGSFNSFANSHAIQRGNTDLLIDGGNIVDNYAGRVITTTRFLEDNRLSKAEGVEQLKSLLGASEVAIITPDEEVLAHSDGMVSWIDDNTLLINDYTQDPNFRTEVMTELQTAFPNANIIEVPVEYGENAPGEWEGFESACGINLNATVTKQNIYVPTFSMSHEAQVLATMRANTSKNVIEVDATGVCGMGGSVRCLTWQLEGLNAEKLILAARN